MYLSAASWAGQLVMDFTWDGLDIHPALVVGLLPVTELQGIAVATVHLKN